MKSKPTQRERAFSVLLFSLCFLTGSAIANTLYWLFAGGMSPFLVNLLFGFYFAVGAIAFVRPDPTDIQSLIKGFCTSAIWPYLAWKRIEVAYSTPTSRVHVVYINDIAAGKISDADWCGIRLSVLRDPRPYIMQALNIIKMCALLCQHLLWAIPLLIFWSAVFLAAFYPDDYSAVVALLQEGPAAIGSAILILMRSYGVVLIVIAPFAFLFLGYRFGFVSHFAMARATLIRQHLKIVTDGKIAVNDWVDLRTVIQ